MSEETLDPADVEQLRRYYHWLRATARTPEIAARADATLAQLDATPHVHPAHEITDGGDP